MILSCDCKNAFQDKQYGKGMRVFNPTKENGARCTVCGRNTNGGGKKK